MRSGDQELDAAARVLAGRALLRRTTETLAPEGIVPVVLKGVLISALTEGRGEPPRPALDVDVLVAPEARARAERCLHRAGLVPLARTATATTLRDPELGIDLDLHEALVEPELFRLEPRGVLARARVDRALFGFAVRVPDGRDLYAHLVAHFVRNRSNARDVRRLRDLAVVADALGLKAQTVASHLAGHGLARAARYVLSLACEAGDAFAAGVLAALPDDPVGEALARGARAWLALVSGPASLAMPVPHLLNATLPAGARSLAAHVWRRVRSPARLRAELERAHEGR